MVIVRIPDLGLLDTVTVVVARPVSGEPDPFGQPTTTWEEETVAGVLATPGSTSNLAADRPDGTRVDMTFGFPRGYARSLAGCKITYNNRTYSVIGDPQASMETLTPGAWSLAVETEKVDG